MKRWTYSFIAIGVISVIAFFIYEKMSPATIHHSNTLISFADNHTPISTPAQSKQIVKPQRNESQASTLYQQGVTAFSNRQYSKAIGLENKAIQTDNSFYDAYNVLGISLCYAGDYSNGIANINQSLKLAPDDGYARFNRALALELYGHYDEALTAYHYTLKLHTHDWWIPWSYYGIASIYGRRGDVTNTVQYLQLAIQLNPAIKREARTEADFNNVRNSKAFQSLIQS